MQEVQLITKVITQDEDGFEINGMVYPEFHNDGNTEVVIQNQTIEPGDSFKAGLPNHVSIGSVNIGFVESSSGGDAPLNKVVLQYFLVVQPHINPQNGAKITDQQKQVIKSHNSSC